jgi:hypothetical protein
MNNEPYYVTMARIKREMRTHKMSAQADWLKNHKNAHPRTESERQAALMSEPYNEGADITIHARKLWSLRRELGDSI